MKRILFVDDDLPVLDGLRARLHRMSNKWAMAFVDSGGRALAEFQRQPFDVIVSDVRMPGIQGGRLLRTVSERWPEAVRIALSGLTDPEVAVRFAPLAHQFLSKPCESRVLEDVIERCLDLQRLLRQPALRAIVGRMRQLPALRGTYARLQRTLANEEVSVREVAEVVATDPVIAAKVLQMVNSAFFRSGRRMTNIEQAVGYLGFAAIRNLVLSAEVFTLWPMQTRDDSPLDLERLQQHAQQVMMVTRALTARSALADDALLAALLHDIGYWILAHECPHDLERAYRCARDEGITLEDAEREVLGASHAQLGAYLLGIWGLPYTVVEAVAHHHAPQRVAQKEFDVLAALAVAHALAGFDDTSAFGGPLAHDQTVDAAYLESLGAPFSWEEASLRARECLSSKEPAS